MLERNPVVMTSKPRQMNLQLEKLVTAVMAIIVGALSVQASPVDGIASTCKANDIADEVCTMAGSSKVQLTKNQTRSNEWNAHQHRHQRYSWILSITCTTTGNTSENHVGPIRQKCSTAAWLHEHGAEACRANHSDRFTAGCILDKT